MNRAVALRIAACGIMGLGAALLIAALLLSTYTKSKITKIPLDIDATLVSDGTGTALRSRRRSPATEFVVNKNVPLCQQQQISVESPANADVVTLQVGRLAAAHRQAAGQRAAAGHRRHRHPQPQDGDGGVERQQPRRRGAEAAHDRGRRAADQHRAAPRGAGLPLPVRHREEDLPVLRPDRAEGVRRQLRRRRRRQRADHLPVHPERRLRRRRQAGRTRCKYASLYDDDEDSQVTASARGCGACPATPRSRSP